MLHRTLKQKIASAIAAARRAMPSRRRLLDNNHNLTVALDTMSQGLCMFDTDARFVMCNEHFRQIYNLPSYILTPGVHYREFMRHSVAEGRIVGDVDELVAQRLKLLADGVNAARITKFRDGKIVSVVNRAMPGGGWVSTHEDITEQRRAEERIAYLAHHDTLTELPNRAAFGDYLASTIARAETDKTAFALIAIDLNRFKEVNDVFGHPVGDALLVEVARRLRVAAEGSFVARLGGDEFMIICQETEQPAVALTDRLQSIVVGPTEINAQQIQIELSVGVAVYPQDGADQQSLFSNSDAALYRSKKEGGTQFFDSDLGQTLRENRMLQQELNSVIQLGQLELHYQPQARIDGGIIGFEALARWRHPERGFIPPARFIPLAEDNGQIVAIGAWILREACREAASWPNHLNVAVNLSPVQFRHGDLPSLIHSILLETGLAPSRLELEITEGMLIGDFARTLAILRRLKAFGIRIAMDDFGTGYSSLSYLQSFPFDKIKIDRSFIANVENDPQSAVIVRAAIGLGRALDIEVVAEGVESAAQCAMLKKDSRNEIQGYWIGRPLPIGAYASLTGMPETGARKSA